MTKTKLITSILAVAATFGTAHAAQVMGTTCADNNNGTFGETALRQPVICSSGQWQDATTVPMASVEITKYSADKTFEASYVDNAFVGTRSIRQRIDEVGQFTLIATVEAVNPDNTAQVAIDLDDFKWHKHIDATVPLDVATAIATDGHGAEYRVMVRRTPA